MKLTFTLKSDEQREKVVQFYHDEMPKGADNDWIPIRLYGFTVKAEASSLTKSGGTPRFSYSCAGDLELDERTIVDDAPLIYLRNGCTTWTGVVFMHAFDEQGQEIATAEILVYVDHCMQRGIRLVSIAAIDRLRKAQYGF